MPIGYFQSKRKNKNTLTFYPITMVAWTNNLLVESILWDNLKADVTECSWNIFWGSKNPCTDQLKYTDSTLAPPVPRRRQIRGRCNYRLTQKVVLDVGYKDVREVRRKEAMMRCDESGLSRQIKNQFLEIRVRDVKTSNILSEFIKSFQFISVTQHEK